MVALPAPAGLVRSLALLCGVGGVVLVGWRAALPILASSDLVSVAALVGGVGVVAWAAAQVASIDHLTAPQAFAAGVTLPLSAVLLLPRRPACAANDNDHPFSGSWPQFISE